MTMNLPPHMTIPPQMLPQHPLPAPTGPPPPPHTHMGENPQMATLVLPYLMPQHMLPQSPRRPPHGPPPPPPHSHINDGAPVAEEGEQPVPFEGLLGGEGEVHSMLGPDDPTTHPILPSSHGRYENGTRVWMVTAKRDKGKQEWVKADVYHTEGTSGGTRVSMREVEGREEFIMVVPHQPKASPHGLQCVQVHEGFTLVERAPRDESDSNKHGQHVGLFDLPPDVERDVVFALLGPGDLARLRRTCTLGSRRVSEDYVKTRIDAHLTNKGIKHIISYRIKHRTVGHMLRLLYFIEQSGDWAGWEPIIRVAKHQGRGGGQLSIELGSADVEAVGSRAVFDGRCEAMRQLSPIARHIGVRHENHDGEERWHGRPLTIYTPQTLLLVDHPFRNGFDPANPVCEYDGWEYASLRDAVLDQMRYGGSVVADESSSRWENATRYNRLHSLSTQQPPVWDRRTISTSHRPALPSDSVSDLPFDHPGLGRFDRVIVLHGDQPGHTFQAHLITCVGPDFVRAHFRTTEPPVDSEVGAARLPQTARVAREVIGADAETVFGSWCSATVGCSATV